MIIDTVPMTKIMARLVIIFFVTVKRICVYQSRYVLGNGGAGRGSDECLGGIGDGTYSSQIPCEAGSPVTADLGGHAVRRGGLQHSVRCVGSAIAERKSHKISLPSARLAECASR